MHIQHIRIGQIPFCQFVFALKSDHLFSSSSSASRDDINIELLDDLLHNQNMWREKKVGTVRISKVTERMRQEINTSKIPTGGGDVIPVGGKWSEMTSTLNKQLKYENVTSNTVKECC